MSEQIQTKLQLAVAMHQAGRLAEAQAIYREVLKLAPDHFDALHLSGVADLQTGKLEAGLALIDRALAVRPGSAPAHNNRGNALKDLKRPDEALASYDQALALRPDYADAHNNRGNILLAREHWAEALASYDRALALTPGDAELYNNRGNALAGLKRLDEALAAFDKALALRPGYPEAHNNRGNVLLDTHRGGDALAAYDRALALRPSYTEAHNNRGNALRALGRLEEALACYDKALALDPNYAEAHSNRGNVLASLKRLDEALASYRSALALRPDHPFLLGSYLNAKTKLCDWEGLAEELNRLAAGISSRKRVTAPYAALSLIDAPELHKIAAQVFTADKYPSRRAPLPMGGTGRKIRVGYYSSDFNNHALSYLLAGMFELHDKERFDVYGVSIGPEKNDEMRARLSSAFTQFIDAGRKSDRDIVALSRELGIDIAVDLNGATDGARTGIFAEGCAPVQVNYLGYAGTMGAPYMDYAMVDKIVVPPERQPDYSEALVYLPYCFMITDSSRKVPAGTFTRRDFGLPDTGFVYCCFNRGDKILPATFDGWMRILKAVDHSVLWLVGENATATGNLRAEARARGVNPDRLIFADRAPYDIYLARFGVADLFLDTLPYNAHTTAADALWLGLPVLTCRGVAYAGRAAASWVTAVGLPDLVTATQDAFEAKAVELATHPAALRAVKAALDRNRAAAPVFDTRLRTKHVESAYEIMLARHRQGLPPAVIDIQP